MLKLQWGSGVVQRKRIGSKAQPVGVLTKALKILETIRCAPAGLGLKEIAKQTDVNKSTAYRFLAHFEREGYLSRDEDGFYTIGLKLNQMAPGPRRERDLREVARPVLRDLVASTGESVNLAALDGTDILYLEVFESPHAFRLVSTIGYRRPLYATALGKSIAAFLPAEQAQRILPSIRFQPLTPHTITNLAEFTRELEAIRAQGYSVDHEENLLGACCVAAPILNQAGEAAAAVSVSGPISRISEDKVSIFAAAVKEAAAKIGTRLGFSASRNLPVDSGPRASKA
jgi:IclR family KDG regulon transcriptional repressor